MLEWADAWLEDSMATTGGKLRGVIPQDIVETNNTVTRVLHFDHKADSSVDAAEAASGR